MYNYYIQGDPQLTKTLIVVLLNWGAVDKNIYFKKAAAFVNFFFNPRIKKPAELPDSTHAHCSSLDTPTAFQRSRYFSNHRIESVRVSHRHFD